MKYIATFFIALFMAFIVLPTVVLLLKNDANISYVYTLAEEEENKSGGEKETNIETSWKLIPRTDFTLSQLNHTHIEQHYFYILKNNLHHSEVLSPPPEVS